MKRIKNILSLLLTLAIFLNHLPVSVLAVEYYESDTDETAGDSDEYQPEQFEEPDTSSDMTK